VAINNYINEKIILPLSDIALRQSIKKHLDFLQKSQWWSENELKEYQNEKLRALKNMPMKMFIIIMSCLEN